MMTFEAKREQPGIRLGKLYAGAFVSHEGRIWLVLHDETGRWDLYDPNDFEPCW